jgi:alkane 1-monooxygenase
MHFRWIKYYSPLFFFLGAFISFYYRGWLGFFPVCIAFAGIPLLELLLKPNDQNLTAIEEEMVKKDVIYDYILYVFFFLQLIALLCFLYTVSQHSLSILDLAGCVTSMGVLCGIFGINLAHELGHRAHKTEQFLAKTLLLSSLYMHFFIEHNKGHHKRVATNEDPASAQFNESLFHFYFRSILGSYISAWEIANTEMKKRKLPAFHYKNQMLQFQLIQILFLAGIAMLFSVQTMILFFAAACFGIFLLESINYIEHYGLSRNSIAPGKYERPMPHHSWNSNHVLGRVMLFELSRHSDHHYLASRKYQILRHHESAPQMPTGYPGMLVLAHIPPLWFKVMNPLVEKYSKRH